MWNQKKVLPPRDEKSEKDRSGPFGEFQGRSGAGMSGELKLVDVEAEQLEDLTAMRGRPELLPYRRYLYVGEISLDRETRNRMGSAVRDTRFFRAKTALTIRIDRISSGRRLSGCVQWSELPRLCTMV
jgi:hypothetical protein